MIIAIAGANVSIMNGLFWLAPLLILLPAIAVPLFSLKVNDVIVDEREKALLGIAAYRSSRFVEIIGAVVGVSLVARGMSDMKANFIPYVIGVTICIMLLIFLIAYYVFYFIGKKSGAGIGYGK